jgi:hypothetical protein
MGRVAQWLKVPSTKIGAEKCGFDPRSVRQFLVRIGEEVGRLSTADCSSELRVRDRKML